MRRGGERKGVVGGEWRGIGWVDGGMDERVWGRGFGGEGREEMG